MNKILRTVGLYILTGIALIGIPIIIIPSNILRFLVSILAKILRPDLLSLVSHSSSVWTVEIVYDSTTTKSNCNITEIATFDKKVSYSELCNLFELRILRNENCTKLRRHCTQWLGFSFWKSDLKFQTSDHLLCYTGRRVDGQENLIKLGNHVNRGPWKVGNSPWSGTLIENYGKDGSALIFNIHHSLADAYSTQCLLNELLDNSNGKSKAKLQLPCNDITKPKSKNEKSETILTSFRAFVMELFTVWDTNKKTHFHGPNISKDREIHYSNEASLKWSEIETIKEKAGVSFTSIAVVAVSKALAAAFPKCATELGNIRLMFPYSHLGHDGTLENFQSFVFLPTTKDLSVIEANIAYQRSNHLSKYYQFVPKLIGGLPNCLIKHLHTVQLPSGLLISLAIDEAAQLCGSNVTNILFLSGPLPGDQGLFIFFMKYVNILNVGVGISRSIGDEETVKTLANSIVSEINQIKDQYNKECQAILKETFTSNEY